ncbi:MAG: hypothetical protein AVDCRST_MAG20-2183, partial [uncultured Acidimicrobiales bacterium]
ACGDDGLVDATASRTRCCDPHRARGRHDRAAGGGGSRHRHDRPPRRRAADGARPRTGRPRRRPRGVPVRGRAAVRTDRASGPGAPRSGRAALGAPATALLPPHPQPGAALPRTGDDGFVAAL